MKSHAKQLQFLPKLPKEYGGANRTRRKYRGARPLASRHTIHLVLRSTKAVKELSFLRHHALIERILKCQAQSCHVKLISWSNVGNHLHMHIQLPRVFRESYVSFIRAITGLIALKLMKASKTNRIVKSKTDRFWDLRPFTRVLSSWREFKNLKHYILINDFESLGFSRREAEVRAHEQTHDSG